MRLRVGLDVSAALPRRPTGVARAIRGLLQGLREEGSAERFVLCLKYSRWRPWRVLPRPRGRGAFRPRLFGGDLPPALLRSLHLFHGLDVRLPRQDSIPLIATFHDLSAIEDGGFTPEGFRDRRLRQWEDAAGRATKIVVYSDFVREEVVRRFSLRRENVVVIPLGVSPLFAPSSEAAMERVRRRYHLPRRYILSVGGLSRRKGSIDLLEAFGQLGDVGMTLVICGRDGHGAEEAKDSLRALGLRGRVRLLGHIPRDSDLVPLYSGASAFVQASLYEGFGLAILEAMACGTPVVACRGGAIPEVAETAAMLVNPGEPRRLKSAMEEVLQDEDVRQDLVSRGLRRADEFTWAATARATLDLYRDLAPAILGFPLN